MTSMYGLLDTENKMIQCTSYGMRLNLHMQEKYQA